jgi:hypothetical protein
MARKDVHRPSVIDPAEYVFVSFHDHRPDAAIAALAEQQAFHAHMAKTGGKFSGHEHGGVCHVCGNAHAMTVARFWHQPTNSYIEVGETCAFKLYNGEALDFRSFRNKAKAGIQAAAGKRKAEKILMAEGLSRAYEIYAANDWASWGYEESTIANIIGKLVKYGNISARQVDFIGKLMAQIDSRAAVAAQRLAEAEAAAPIPAFDGRAQIEGEVVSVKAVDTPYGSAIKMVVKAAAGWKIYGTVPASVEVSRGDVVRFEAKVTVSQDDPKFGFFKRPTKAEVIKVAA